MWSHCLLEKLVPENRPKINFCQLSKPLSLWGVSGRIKILLKIIEELVVVGLNFKSHFLIKGFGHNLASKMTKIQFVSCLPRFPGRRQTAGRATEAIPGRPPCILSISTKKPVWPWTISQIWHIKDEKIFFQTS